MEYDVFISCKSEDYSIARKIYNYLTAHNYSTFLADMELRVKGNAEYGEIIDDALDSAKHLIVVATQPQYVISAYVKSEWRTFIEEKRSGRKTGNIITVVDFSIDLLPIGLRHFQSFDINSFGSIVDYLPNDRTNNRQCATKISHSQSCKDMILNAKKKIYKVMDNDTLHALSKAENKNANIELGKRYFLGIKGKCKSETIAKYYWNKAELMVEDYLKSKEADDDVNSLSNDVLLELCKVGHVQACIEMGMRYFRGIKGKNKSETMAKYYWNKVGYYLDD